MQIIELNYIFEHYFVIFVDYLTISSKNCSYMDLISVYKSYYWSERVPVNPLVTQLPLWVDTGCLQAKKWANLL